jgi:small subunit ribosomal protein S2
MLEYERMQASGEVEVMIKKEALLLEREMIKLQRNLGGMRSLKKAPDAIFVLDTNKEHIAVTEARKLGIPVVAVVDTNVNPEVITYPIPGNDDAIRSNSLFARVIADAVAEGRFIANKRNPAPTPVAEKTAEEVAAFEAAQTDARNAAAAQQAARDAKLSAAKDAPAAVAPAAAAAPAEAAPVVEASAPAEAAPVEEASAPVEAAAAPVEAAAVAAAEAETPAEKTEG